MVHDKQQIDWTGAKQELADFLSTLCAPPSTEPTEVWAEKHVIVQDGPGNGIRLEGEKDQIWVSRKELTGELVKALPAGAVKSLGERGKKAKAVLETTLKVMGGVQQLQAMAPSFDVSWTSNDDKLRVIEECFPADSECVVLGTCTENPDSQSEDDRMLICQGENEKTFLLSTKTEVKLGRNIRNNALIMLLLAMVLIVGAFAIALHASGML